MRRDLVSSVLLVLGLVLAACGDTSEEPLPTTPYTIPVPSNT